MEFHRSGLSESLRLSVDAVPESIDSDEITRHMKEVPGVKDVHHIHIWPISTTETALTAHAVIADGTEPETAVAAIKQELKEHGIVHATIETERDGYECAERECR